VGAPRAVRDTLNCQPSSHDAFGHQPSTVPDTSIVALIDRTGGFDR
jgi:hypothetical protein